MKLKLLAFTFILAFAIASFGALGVGGASAQITIDTQGSGNGVGHTVAGPCAAINGFNTAFAAITTQGPGDIPLDVVSVNC